MAVELEQRDTTKRRERQYRIEFTVGMATY
jgi:hypothetical protein